VEDAGDVVGSFDDLENTHPAAALAVLSLGARGSKLEVPDVRRGANEGLVDVDAPCDGASCARARGDDRTA